MECSDDVDSRPDPFDPKNFEPLWLPGNFNLNSVRKVFNQCITYHNQTKAKYELKMKKDEEASLTLVLERDQTIAELRESLKKIEASLKKEKTKNEKFVKDKNRMKEELEKLANQQNIDNKFKDAFEKMKKQNVILKKKLSNVQEMDSQNEFKRISFCEKHTIWPTASLRN